MNNFPHFLNLLYIDNFISLCDHVPFYLHIKLPLSVYATEVAVALHYICLQISFYGLKDFSTSRELDWKVRESMYLLYSN